MNARNKGHNYERKIRKELREMGWRACETSRYANRALDDQKVDLANTDPYQIQCKAVERGINYHDLLGEMPKNAKINCVFHKKNRKEVVVLSKQDFYNLICQQKKKNLKGD